MRRATADNLARGSSRPGAIGSAPRVGDGSFERAAFIERASVHAATELDRIVQRGELSHGGGARKITVDDGAGKLPRSGGNAAHVTAARVVFERGEIGRCRGTAAPVASTTRAASSSKPHEQEREECR